MKNRPILYNHKVIVASFIVLFIVALIPIFALAQPSVNPPNGNINANFNSVTVNPGTEQVVVQPNGHNIELTAPRHLLLNINGGNGALMFHNVSGHALTMNSYGIWDAIGNLSLVDNVDVQGSLSTTNNVTGQYALFNTFYDRNNMSYYLFPSGLSKLLQVEGNYASFKRFDDKDNPNYFIDPFGTSNMYRGEFLSTADASGGTGTGALEIANSLRLDGNEIVTNTGSTLYLQHDNAGDLMVDSGTLFVDASSNNVGIGKLNPYWKLDVSGEVQFSGSSGSHRFYGDGDYYTTGNIYPTGDIYTLNGDLTTTNGHIKAKTIGSFSLRSTYGTYSPGSGSSISKTCGSGEIALSCGYYIGLGGEEDKATITWLYPNNGTCYASVKNDSASKTLYFYLYAQCWNPNG